MKIIVTGATGLVGRHAIASALRRGHEVHALYYNSEPLNHPGIASQRRVELGTSDEITSLILELFPDAIINAAAPAPHLDPTEAEKLLAALPRTLAQLANHLSARLIHLSTVEVFDGTDAPYRSTDMPAPLDLHGQMKLMAERDVLRYGAEFQAVLRLPMLLGNSASQNRSYHERLLHHLARGETWNAASNRTLQPCSASNLGDVLVELCERPNLHGLFHWAGNQSVTEYQLAQAILAHFGLNPDYIQAIEEPQKRDYSMLLPPLLGKLNTQPSMLAEQLGDLQVPSDLTDWYAKETGTQPAITRLRKGIDF